MTPNDIDADIDAIRAAILQWPRATITGGQLASLIRSTAPSMDIRATVGIPKGTGALTEFIKRYLSDQVEHLGKQGMDTLHHVKGKEIDAAPSPPSPEIWRSFVSPNSQQQIILSKSSGLLLSRESPASPKDDELNIPKATSAEHDAIRADFMGSLPEPSLTAVRDNLSPDAEFEPWITALRTHAPEQIKSWGSFRRRRLSELLAARIAQAPVDAGLREKISAQARAAEAAAYDTRRTAKAQLEGSSASLVPNEVANEATTKARSLARAAIDRLSYDELRALKIPLGALLDAVRTEH